MPSRLFPTFYAALFAYVVARACGVPKWSDFTPGDAADIGVGAGCLMYNLLGFARKLCEVSHDR